MSSKDSNKSGDPEEQASRPPRRKKRVKVPEGPVAFAEELGVQDLKEIVFAERGRLFSAAGPDSPIAEFAGECLVMHPPQNPFTDEPGSQVIVYSADERGVMLNELGEPKRILGAKYRGQNIFTLAERKPGTDKHPVVWFDAQGAARKLYYEGELLTSDVAYRLRNKSLDGELSALDDLTSD